MKGCVQGRIPRASQAAERVVIGDYGNRGTGFQGAENAIRAMGKLKIHEFGNPEPYPTYFFSNLFRTAETQGADVSS